jgi:hypothetical protein
MDEPRSAWTLLATVDDFGRPLAENQPGPYGALVVALDFGEIAVDDLWRLCVWLVMTGCRSAAFHGVGSPHAENVHHQAVIIAKLAIDGDVGLQQIVSEVWAGP